MLKRVHDGGSFRIENLAGKRPRQGRQLSLSKWPLSQKNQISPPPSYEKDIRDCFRVTYEMCPW